MKQLLAIAILGMLLTGCSKSVDSKSKTFTYPLALGNQWTYSVTLTWDHGDPTIVDTIEGNSAIVNVTVTQVDTIRPGVLSYTMRGIDAGSEMPDGPPERTYLNLSEGMYLLSRKTAMSNAQFVLPRRVPQPPGAISRDPPPTGFPNAYAMVAALADPAGPTACNQAVPADTLPLVLAYPQHTGLVWTYYDSTDAWPYRIEKVIEGRETITTPAGSFECWRIRQISTPSLGRGDLVDYVSPEGLIRRRFEGRLSNGLWTTTCDLTSFTLR
jgi:hypothetical protein